MIGNKDLKPCPFCGNEPILEHGFSTVYNSVTVDITCKNCGIRFRWHVSIEDLEWDFAAKKLTEEQYREGIKYARSEAEYRVKKKWNGRADNVLRKDQ